MRSTTVRVRGEVLRRARLRLGLSQRDLAFLARPCSQTTIYLIENGRMPGCNILLARRLAKRVDVPFDELAEPG